MHAPWQTPCHKVDAQLKACQKCQKWDNKAGAIFLYFYFWSCALPLCPMHMLPCKNKHGSRQIQGGVWGRICREAGKVIHNGKGRNGCQCCLVLCFCFCFCGRVVREVGRGGRYKGIRCHCRLDEGHNFFHHMSNVSQRIEGIRRDGSGHNIMVIKLLGR